MKKKIFLILILGIILLGSVISIINLPNGNKLLTKQEFSQLTNNQIFNYMKNNLNMTRYEILDNKILVYYNLTYVEPTHRDGLYRVFSQEKPFKINIDLYEECLNLTTLQTCKIYLVDRTTPFYYITNGNNRTILSTNYLAIQEQTHQFERVKLMRDKALNNTLEDLGNLI